MFRVRNIGIILISFGLFISLSYQAHHEFTENENKIEATGTIKSFERSSRTSSVSIFIDADDKNIFQNEVKIIGWNEPYNIGDEVTFYYIPNGFERRGQPKVYASAEPSYTKILVALGLLYFTAWFALRMVRHGLGTTLFRREIRRNTPMRG